MFNAKINLKTEIIDVFESQPRNVKKFDFIEKDKKVIYGTVDGEVNIYNTIKKHSSPVFSSKSPITGLSVSRKDCLVAFCSENSSFTVGKYSNGLLKSNIMHGNQKTILSMDFTVDCSSIVTGSIDKSVKFYNIEKMNFSGSLIGHNNWVKTVSCSEFDRDVVASGSDDGTIKIWDMRCKTLIDTLDLPHSGSLPSPNAIYFIDNGQNVAVISNNMDENEPCGFYQLFDLRTLKLLQLYPTKNVNIIASDLKKVPSGDHILALLDSDSICHLINLEAGLCLVKLTSPLQSGASDLKFSPSNHQHIYLCCPSDKFILKWYVSQLNL